VPVVSSTATPISNQQPTTVLPQPESNLIYRPTPTETPVAKAVTNVDLPSPAPPNTPNTLVGMVLDENNKIVENAIIEIRDKNQTPVKALKSNQLGQFFSASPLDKGLYEIEVQKPGLQFDIISLNLKNQIVPPLEIKAKS